jgi:hypothetical protein
VLIPCEGGPTAGKGFHNPSNGSSSSSLYLTMLVLDAALDQVAVLLSLSKPPPGDPPKEPVPASSTRSEASKAYSFRAKAGMCLQQARDSAICSKVASQPRLESRS